MKVLIIDDHSLIRKTLKIDILQASIGTQVFQGENFEQGVFILQTEEIDIVVIDIDKPGARGVIMIQYIRLHHHNMIILVHSGFDEHDYAQPFLKAGANGFLSKKASAEDFINAWLTIVAIYNL